MPLRKLAYPVYLFGRKTARGLRIARPLRRVLGPAIGRWVFRNSANGNSSITVNGHRMVLAVEGRYPPVNMALGRYEPETTRLITGLIGPGMTVIDVGAHVGYYSLLAAGLVGRTGKVYSFEPEPDNYALLIGNVGLNAYENVVTLEKAVSNRTGTVPFFLTSLDSGRHSVYSHGLPSRGRIDVEATTLDQFLKAEGWPRIDLIKIDVEGAESEVLDGMKEALKRWEGIRLIVELNPSLLRNAEADATSLFEKLTSFGFHVWSVDEEDGARPLKASTLDSLASKLEAEQTSVNLLCSRRWEEFVS